MSEIQVQDAQKLEPKLRLTRRVFIGEIVAASVALSALPAISTGVILGTDGHARLMKARSTGVVSIHMDQPYWDASGAAVPYSPPRGMRAAAPVANLSEQAFRSMHYYV